jgi:hypothetical protein
MSCIHLFKQYKGSQLAFTALLDKMCELQKVAICVLLTRRNASIRLVALMPQVHLKDVFISVAGSNDIV